MLGFAYYDLEREIMMHCAHHLQGEVFLYQKRVDLGSCTKASKCQGRESGVMRRQRSKSYSTQDYDAQCPSFAPRTPQSAATHTSSTSPSQCVTPPKIDLLTHTAP
jgi:hypothetical protein